VIQEQTYGEQQVSDVAHPRQVSQAAETPVVRDLRQEKNERKESDQSQASL